MKKQIYTVATAHLDTSWSWTLETTVGTYLKNTIYDNFSLFEKYPEYVFSFEGSYRYELMEEYYPEEFKKLKEYIAAGRWHVAGSSYENGDVNVPSPEALFRNILYGNSYFEEKFNKRSLDIYLPDCFGFGVALPSVAAHAGLTGFTTQKLPWSSCVGIPFDLGVWQGINGDRIFACLDGRDYNYTLKKVRDYKPVARKLVSNSVHYDLPMTDILYGIGDRGGSPREESVKAVCDEIKMNPVCDWEVVPAATDSVFRAMAELSDEQKAKLPVFSGELISADHGVGSYTSRAPSKRFNRRGETLAAATENICLLANYLGVYKYPQSRIDRAWKRIIAHQFHDDITGTSLAPCYKRNWNDYLMSLNELSEEYRTAAGAVSAVTDTSFAEGTPVIVHNPLQYKRHESVEVRLPEAMKYTFASVFDRDGNELPSQFSFYPDGSMKVVFSAELCGFSVAAFDIRNKRSTAAFDKSALSVTERTLENDKYCVVLDDNGDICSVTDKEMLKELLKSPVRMGLIDYDGSETWPAWEMNYSDNKHTPQHYAAEPEFFIEEKGAARVAIKTVRHAKSSDFIQIISLDRGGKFISVQNDIEWRSLRTLQKTEFSFDLSNSEASFDLGLGYIKRGNMKRSLYEVPAQNWADITDKSGDYGVSVFSDSKYGWDKFDDSTLRLTGMHTPRAPWRDSQHMLDLGTNRFGFALFSHFGSALIDTNKYASCFNSPMAAFLVSKNDIGIPSYTLMSVNTDDCIIRCTKKAQDTSEAVIRVNEADGKNVSNVVISFIGGIDSITELNGSEEYKADINKKNGRLQFDLKPFEVRTFAVKLFTRNDNPSYGSVPVSLPENIDFATANGEETDSALPSLSCVPKEILPEKIISGGIAFTLSDKATACRGQRVILPEGCAKFSFIAAAFPHDTEAVFTLGEKHRRLLIQSAEECPGKWDLYYENTTGHIKRQPLAWNFTHTHDLAGKDKYCSELYFFRYDLYTAGADSIILPDDENIVIIAASAVKHCPICVTGRDMYDSLEPRAYTYHMSSEERRNAHTTRVGHFRRSAYNKLWFARCRVDREIRQLSGNTVTCNEKPSETKKEDKKE